MCRFWLCFRILVFDSEEVIFFVLVCFGWVFSIDFGFRVFLILVLEVIFFFVWDKVFLGCLLI